MKIKLRKATKADAKLLWEWRNEKTSRESAFDSTPIPYRSHLQWFESKLKDANSIILIALNNEGIPIGQIRFDPSDNITAEVDVLVSEKYRGRGYGTDLIKLGCSQVFAQTEITIIISRIKKSNITSIKAFSHAGFRKIRDTVYKNHDIVELKLEKNES
jgi:RimJ/RimL family protein N-acetyltransferase